MRLTAKELEEMQSVNIGAVSADALADVSGMAFDRTLPREERLARFVKENALARHNTTQAHKERMLPKNRHISHPMPEYPPPGLGLFLTNWGDEEYRKTRRYLLFPPCQQ